MNAKVNAVCPVGADLSVLALAEIFRFQWDVSRFIEVRYVRDAQILMIGDTRSSEVGERSVETNNA
ncbi:hypothetical protein [Phormidesmis sp. 146-33]